MFLFLKSMMVNHQNLVSDFGTKIKVVHMQNIKFCSYGLQAWFQ